MTFHTVSETSRMSGVSVRALHHYDDIGLLKPDHVGENGYRYYGRQALLRLQQILLHREMGLSLSAIGRILDDPAYDPGSTLQAHRDHLAGEARRYQVLLETVDRTLAQLKGDAEVKDKDLYRGFDPKNQAQHEAWLETRYGEGVKAEIEGSKARMKDWRPSDYDAARTEVDQIEADMAVALAQGLPADSEASRAIAGRLHAWVARAWKRPPNREAFIGLAGLYADHPEFRARYEGRAEGLTEYLGLAMMAFAETSLT